MNIFANNKAFTSRLLLGISLVAVMSFMAEPVRATSERMPSSWELNAPNTGPATAGANQAAGQAMGADANAQPDTPQTSAGLAPASPAGGVAPQSTVTARAAQDPCPTPRQIKNNRPDDLAKVQEDIDRFALCVQRAQLLERLNESAERASQTVDSALGFVPPAASAALPQAGGGGNMMPPLPAAAMAGFDVSPMPQTSQNNASGQTASAAGNAASHSAGTEKVEVSVDVKVSESPKEAAPAKPSWTIREIFGSVTDMQARLLSPEGSEVLARQGTRLPDGIVVTTITPSGVTARVDGTVHTLEWSGN